MAERGDEVIRRSLPTNDGERLERVAGNGAGGLADRPLTPSEASADESPREIREDIAETRAEMSETIDAIQQRLSPETLKAQAKSAVAEQLDPRKLTAQAQSALLERTAPARQAVLERTATARQAANGVWETVAPQVSQARDQARQLGTQVERRTRRTRGQIAQATSRVDWQRVRASAPALIAITSTLVTVVAFARFIRRRRLASARVIVAEQPLATAHEPLLVEDYVTRRNSRGALLARLGR